MTRIMASVCLLLAAAAPASAEQWVDYKADLYGFTMKVPKGTKIVEKSSAQGWACLYGEHQGVEAFGYAHLGRHHTDKEIEAYGVKVTGIAAKNWKTIDKGKTRGKWTWYRTVVAQQSNTLYVGTYGIGPRGSYMLVLKTTPEDYASDKASYKKWYDSLTLHGGWKIYRAKSYGFSMLVPETAKISEREASGWGELYATNQGVEVKGASKKGVHLDAAKIEAYGVRATGITSDNWKEIHKGKKLRGWKWFSTVKAQKGDRLSVGIYGHGPKGTFVLVIKTTKSDYLKYKAQYDGWYQGIFLD